MADLVIRGMEMPAVCIDNGWYGNCPMDRSWCAQRFAPEGSTTEDVHKEQWNKLPSWCPLAPLPEGHGRLGDLDKLEESLRMVAAYQTGERQQGILGCCETIRMTKAIVQNDERSEREGGVRR